MSQGNVETIQAGRIPLTPETRRHRTLDERIVVLGQPLYRLLTFRRGLVIRQDDFQDHATALEAVGLSE
jgi:hypothetical protein